MKRIIIAIIALFAIVNCGTPPEHVLEGKIDTLGLSQNQYLYLYKLENQQYIPIDSTVVGEEGKFSLDIMEAKNGIYHFGSSLRNTIPIVLNEEAKKLEITINNNQQKQKTSSNVCLRNKKIRTFFPIFGSMNLALIG